MAFPGVSAGQAPHLHPVHPPPRFHFRHRSLSLSLPTGRDADSPEISQEASFPEPELVRLLLRCLMATSESALAFVPRRVKPSASRPPPPSASGRHRAVPSSDDQTTSYPRDVLLKVTLKENECRGKARNSPQRIKAQSRRVLERLVSHSVDYVYVEQAARVLEANAEDEKLERKDVSIWVVPLANYGTDGRPR